MEDSRFFVRANVAGLLVGLMVGGCSSDPSNATGGADGGINPPSGSTTENPTTTDTTTAPNPTEGPVGESTSGLTTGPEGSSGIDDGNSTGTKFDVPQIPDAGIPTGGGGCATDPMADEDGDGFSVNEGDCNDCDANVNPGAIEVTITEPDAMGQIPEPADEDCDGLVDNILPSCDGALDLLDTDPLNAAAAIGLCTSAASSTDWGILSAQYVRADGASINSPIQHGLMNNFGTNVNPLEGDNLLVLSTGNARIPGQPNPCGSQSCQTSGASTAPPGFPQDVPMCPGLDTIFDDISLEVTLRAPTNATGYAFSFKFYTFEYPEWVCDNYNDQFIALVDPAPPGSINGNISFDAMTNPVSVNIAFFEVCAGCPLGTSELQGTGFDAWDDAGGTSWLTTTAPVQPGQEITIRFAIWDTGDRLFDSTVLLDNFRWIADGGTVMVGTTPVG